MFDARQAAKDHAGAYPPFEFVGLDGDTHELPHPLTLTTDQAMQLNAAMKAGDDEGTLALFELLSPDAAEAVRALPAYVTDQLMNAWFEAAGEAGKSEAPPSPTSGGAKPSKRTSPRAASTSGS